MRQVSAVGSIRNFSASSVVGASSHATTTSRGFGPGAAGSGRGVARGPKSWQSESGAQSGPAGGRSTVNALSCRISQVHVAGPIKLLDALYLIGRFRGAATHI